MKKNSKQLSLQQHPSQYDSFPVQDQSEQPGASQRPPFLQGGGHKPKMSGLNQSMDAGINNYSTSLGNIPPNESSHGQLYIPGQDQYHQNYVNSAYDKAGGQQDGGAQGQKPTHYRSGSHAVGGAHPVGGHKGGKKQSVQFSNQADMQNLMNQQQMLVQTSQYNQGQLSQAQIAQMARIQQQNDGGNMQDNAMVSNQARGSSGPAASYDRIQQQKTKRKHHMSQNIQKHFEYSGNMAQMGHPGNSSVSVGGGAPSGPPQQIGVIQKLQQNFAAPAEVNQLSSKRSYENTQNFEKKANRSSKQKFHAQNANQIPQAQYAQNPANSMYETARYNSISSLHNSTNLGNGTTSGSSMILNQSHHQPSQGKERFQGTQKLGKKSTKISGQGGSIILPAGSGLQGVPQLKSQLSKGHHTQQNKNSQQLPLNHSIQSQQQFGQQNHQRMNSVQDSSSLGANMQRGFNSASNAAIQQQAQIVQIYQQQNTANMNPNGSNSMNKIKYQGNQTNNSRKVIPMLQQQQNQVNQAMSHHKRTKQHIQQMSRDRDSNGLLQSSTSKQLIVDSYPNSNYQTFNQNYNSSSNNQNHLQGVPMRKNNLADTSRANRLASREHSSRRALVGGGDLNNVKVIQGDLNPQYNQLGNTSQGLAIPQKKQKSQQAQKLSAGHAHNASLHNLSNQSSFNQTSTQGFFNDSSTNQSNHNVLNNSTQLNQESHKGGPGSSSKASVTGAGGSMKHHQKNASQYTPQLAQSLKHTISNSTSMPHNQSHLQQADNMMLQTKKSGPVASQSHVRQTSVQVAVDLSNQSKKLSIQHRKNKSVLNNQIRINPALQNQQNMAHQGHKMRVSQDNTAGKHKINQYFDNYTDQMQANFYAQQLQNTKASNLSLTQNAQQLQGSNQNLSSATLKHNLSQSTHRKNKTSVIGNGQQKMLGINSSSAFPQSNNVAPNLINGNNHSVQTMKKIIGGTISHSHKSLRSQSSSRKRVASIDSTAALNNMGPSGNDSVSKYNLPIGHHQSSSSKQMSNMSSGHLTPDLSSYTNGASGGSKQHQQKAQKILNDQAGGHLRQNLRPQGNIVIQQQPGPGSNADLSQHHANLKSSQGNRRHSSILKGEHQNKQMIFIDQNNNVTSTQGQPKNRYVQNAQNPHIQHNQTNAGVQSPDLGNEQDSMGSVSSMRANNMVFQDGGTGGGNQKPKAKARQLSSKGHSENYKSQKQSNFNTDKKKSAGKLGGLVDSSNDDYNLQSDLNARGGAGSKKQLGVKSSLKILNKAEKRLDDIDMADVNVPDGVDESLGQGLKGLSQLDNMARGISHGLDQEALDRAERNQGMNRDGRKTDLPDYDLGLSHSINITKEALELGKVPPEQVAQLIAASGHQLTAADEELSPRTREMVEISNAIRRSFLQKGDAPKTTPDFYRAGKMLGRGAFGKVSLGMHKLSRKLVALKSINKEFMTDEKQKSKVMHEVGILLRLRHQSVVKLYETFETKRHMLLAMELCAGGDLLNYVRKRKKLDEPGAKVIFKQIIEGLGYIHKKRILHRDIKLDNILLDGKGNVKIADFGVSKLVKPGDVMHEQSGTPAYIAPEILKEEGYMGFKADIWSAGVVFYAMLCGTVPFKASNMKELHKMIIKGKYNLKEEISDDAKSLLRSMLETDPKRRITIQKILQHPWLQLPDDAPEIFNQEEKDIVKREFIYNNPAQLNRSEKVNNDVEPWDCFTELNLDSINQTLRNESEKSVILAPFNSSISDFNEDEYKGMEASLIIHRLFDDAAPLQDKKASIRFAARCRDQDRQYEINNNGELDNGVYHKFVYSSRDGGPEPSSSVDDVKGGSVNDLRPQSSRNLNKHSGPDFKNEIDKRVREGKRMETELTDDIEYGDESTDSLPGLGLPGRGAALDEKRMQTLIDFGYPEDYVRFCLLENEACYCLAGYYLLGEDQNY